MYIYKKLFLKCFLVFSSVFLYCYSFFPDRSQLSLCIPAEISYVFDDISAYGEATDVMGWGIGGKVEYLHSIFEEGTFDISGGAFVGGSVQWLYYSVSVIDYCKIDVLYPLGFDFTAGPSIGFWDNHLVIYPFVYDFKRFAHKNRYVETHKSKDVEKSSNRVALQNFKSGFAVNGKILSLGGSVIWMDNARGNFQLKLGLEGFIGIRLKKNF